MALALFNLVCRKVRMVIDFLFDINTFEVWVCLISADLIKQVENPVTIPWLLSASRGRPWRVRRFLPLVGSCHIVVSGLAGEHVACLRQRHPCS
jgi:hypothetical protein